MHKSILMYFLLVLGYFVLSTFSFTEVSAQSISITSGNGQSVARRQVHTLTVNITGVEDSIKLWATGESTEVRLLDQIFKSYSSITVDKNKSVSIDIQSGKDAVLDEWTVRFYLTKLNGNPLVSADLLYGPEIASGKVTGILWFVEGDSTTRNVDPGAPANTKIGAPISATHFKHQPIVYPLEYSVIGTKASLFRFPTESESQFSDGQLLTAAPMDPAVTRYDVTVKVVEGDNSSDTIQVTIYVGEIDAGTSVGEIDAGTTESLTVRRVNSRTVTLSWDIPTALNAQAITGYQYSTDGGQTWTSTGSTDTSITITGDGLGALPLTQFKIRAMNQNADGSRSFVIISARPKRRIIYQCPVGWTQGSVFGKTKKALIYELKVKVEPTDRISIYQLKSLAIYVHPDENLETLDGWTLKVGTLYNTFGKELKLTAENSVIDEQDFAHIENPEETPIPMSSLGYIGQSLPSFDYRLYDAAGVRVDFGISCYKGGGLTWRLWNTADPRLLRVLPLVKSEESLSVQMKNLAWHTPFFRSEWTAAVMPDLPEAPAAPSLIKKRVVDTWADLKKQ